MTLQVGPIAEEALEATEIDLVDGEVVLAAVEDHLKA